LPFPTKQPAKLNEVTTNAIASASFFMHASQWIDINQYMGTPIALVQKSNSHTDYLKSSRVTIESVQE